jgi:hypothetical protein
MPQILFVPPERDAPIARRELCTHLCAAIRRRVVDDQYANFDATLIENAQDTLFKIVRIVVAGHNNINGTHVRTPNAR